MPSPRTIGTSLENHTLRHLLAPAFRPVRGPKNTPGIATAPQTPLKFGTPKGCPIAECGIANGEPRVT